MFFSASLVTKFGQHDNLKSVSSGIDFGSKISKSRGYIKCQRAYVLMSSVTSLRSIDSTQHQHRTDRHADRQTDRNAISVSRVGMLTCVKIIIISCFVLSDTLFCLLRFIFFLVFFHVFCLRITRNWAFTISELTAFIFIVAFVN